MWLSNIYMRKEGYLRIKTPLCLALEFAKDHIVTGGLIRYQSYLEGLITLSGGQKREREKWEEMGKEERLPHYQ